MILPAAVAHPREHVPRRLPRLWRLVRRAANQPTWLLLILPGLVVLTIVAVTPLEVRLTMALDLEIYRGYADRLLAGEILYRQVPVEYPPLAVLPMLLPRLIPGGDETMGYLWRFAAVGAALASLTGWLLWRLGGRSRRVLLTWIVLAAVSWPAITLRYDGWVVACAVAGLLLASRGRPGAAGVMLGAGSLLKVFPAFLVLVLFVAALRDGDRRAAIRLVVGASLIALLVLGTAWMMAGPDSLAWLRYQGDRGLQVESTGASILLALHVLAGFPLEVAFRYGAVEVIADGAEFLAGLGSVGLVVVEGLILVLYVRMFREDGRSGHRIPLHSVMLAGAAVVAGLLLASKVFSFQYALWLAPFVPFLPRRERRLGLVVVGLSTAVYTTDYVGLWSLATLPIVMLVVRNVLLVILMAWLASRLVRRGTQRSRDLPEGVDRPSESFA